MTRYANQTSVSVEKSRAEIETTLGRYGASQFGYASDTSKGLAVVQFAAKDRHIKFILRLPSLDDEEFHRTPGGRRKRSEDAAYKAWEQACRQRWRALALCIKAKLEAVESGISEFEDEFMAHIVLPDGKTVGDLMRPQIAKSYIDGGLPPGIAGLLTSQ